MGIFSRKQTTTRSVSNNATHTVQLSGTCPNGHENSGSVTVTRRGAHSLLVMCSVCRNQQMWLWGCS